MPHHGASLDHAQRLRIVELRAAGLSDAAIARRLGVPEQNIIALVTRRMNSGNAEAQAGGDIITRKRYSNFELQADFMITTATTACSSRCPAPRRTSS